MAYILSYYCVCSFTRGDLCWNWNPC